jgi:hypothetical protein
MDHRRHDIKDRCLPYSYPYKSDIKRLFKEGLYRPREILVPRGLLLSIDPTIHALLAYFHLLMLTLED